MWRSKVLTVGRGHADGYQGLRGDGMRSSRRSTVPWHHLSFLLPPALAIVLLFAVSTLTYAIVPPPIIAPIVVAGDPDDTGPYYLTRQQGTGPEASMAVGDQAMVDGAPLATAHDTEVQETATRNARIWRYLQGLVIGITGHFPGLAILIH